MTALTFGCASAADVSIETIRAWAYGLRRTAPCSMPGRLHVVDVVALAAQEAGVLLAEHPAEADRVAGRRQRCGPSVAVMPTPPARRRRRSAVGARPPSGSARTMFS